MRLLIMGLIFMYPISLFGQNLVDEPFPDMNLFWTALADKNWPIVVGVGLTVVVWLIRKYVFAELPKKYLPIVVLVIPMISSASARMIQFAGEGKMWWQGLIQGLFEGLMIGFTAMGTWDIKKSTKKPPVEYYRV